MADLRHDPFFDRRLKDFLQKLLWRRGEGLHALTQDERDLLERVEELVALNQAIEGGLVRLLNDVKYFVTSPDALFFLLEAQKRGQVQEGAEVLFTALRDEYLLTREDLVRILKEAEHLPLPWVMSYIGKVGEERKQEAPPAPRKSGLDLDHMRKFK